MAKSTKTTETSTTTTTPVVEKVVKEDINIKNLAPIKDLTVTEKTSCTIFENANKVRWYLKGHTMEVTTNILPDRIELLSEERLASGRMGKIIGVIRKVKDNNELLAILNHLIPLTLPIKTAKVKEVILAPEVVKDTKKTAKTKAKKVTKITSPETTQDIPLELQEA